MQISQIVVRRLFDTDNVYVFQNIDRRLIFASPYERDFTLIGTVHHAFKGDPAIVATGPAMSPISATRRTAIFASGSNLSTSCGRFRRQPGDELRQPTVRRDGAMRFNHARRKAPLITIFGGDVTTSRLRAETAVSKLTPFYPMSARWTAKTPLPGGEFAWGRFENEVDEARERWRFLGEDQARRLVSAYGLNLKAILGDAKERGDLGPAFGPELTGAEVRYLMAQRMGALSGRCVVAALRSSA